jgi:uncharacterized protein YcbK (DUF882 family)
MKIPEYFKDSELECPCGCGMLPDKRAVERLYALRLIRGKAVSITSGARCPAYNKRIGGADDSQHPKGKGFDSPVKREDEWEFVRIAQAVGFKGIGINNNKFIHVDDRDGKPEMWTY